MSRAVVMVWLSAVVCACQRTPAPPPVAPPARASVIPADAALAIDAPPAATDALVLAKGQAPTKLAVTATDVVWLDEIAGRVMMVSKSGGAAPVELARDQERPLGLAVDADHVYWTTRTGGGAENDSITAPRPTGGVWSLPLAGGTPTALATKRAFPHSIAVDDKYVYFGEQGLDDHGTAAQLSRVAKRGGAVTAIQHGDPGGIVVDGDQLYWSIGGTCESVNGAPMPDDGSLWSSPRAKLAPTQLAAKLRCPEGIAVDGDSIYVADMDGGVILRVPKTGGAPAVAAKDDSHGSRYVAVDATMIYWANQVTGKVRRRAKTGGAIDTLAVLKDPADVRVDDRYLYVTDSETGVVQRLAK